MFAGWRTLYERVERTSEECKQHRKHAVGDMGKEIVFLRSMSDQHDVTADRSCPQAHAGVPSPFKCEISSHVRPASSTSAHSCANSGYRSLLLMPEKQKLHRRSEIQNDLPAGCVREDHGREVGRHPHLKSELTRSRSQHRRQYPSPAASPIPASSTLFADQVLKPSPSKPCFVPPCWQSPRSRCSRPTRPPRPPPPCARRATRSRTIPGSSFSFE